MTEHTVSEKGRDLIHAFGTALSYPHMFNAAEQAAHDALADYIAELERKAAAFSKLEKTLGRFHREPHNVVLITMFDGHYIFGLPDFANDNGEQMDCTYETDFLTAVESLPDAGGGES